MGDSPARVEINLAQIGFKLSLENCNNYPESASAQLIKIRTHCFRGKLKKHPEASTQPILGCP